MGTHFGKILELRKSKKSNNQLFKETLPFLRHSKMTSLQNSVSTNIKLKPSTIVQKHFECINYKLHYSNNYYFKEVQNPPSKIGEIAITNTIFQKEGEEFKKLTQIQIGSKIIVVEDVYKFNDLLNHKQMNKKSPSQADTYNMEMISQVPSQKISEQSECGQESYRRKDKKNIVKNVIKSFVNWLKSEYQRDRSQLNVLESINEIQKLLKQLKFNNQLIFTLINHNVLANIFQYFLRNFARQWLNQSKINDKASHSEAIEMYAKACITKNLECFRVLKKNKKI